jgi:hypothetical protein
MEEVLEHIHFAAGSERWAANWAGEWHYYFSGLPFNLGIAGLLFAWSGICILIWVMLKKRSNEIFPESGLKNMYRACLWPICLVVPSLLLLTALKSKVPWVTVALAHGWVTLQAVTIAAVLYYVKPRMISYVLSLLIIGTGLLPVCCRNYEDVLRKSRTKQWESASSSREVAVKMNNLTSSSDRVLMTSFYYWQGPEPGYLCPIFVYYYYGNAQILMRSHERSFKEILSDVKEYKIDWVVLSPVPGPHANSLFNGFMMMGLEPHRLRMAYIFRTTGIYKNH